jgi:hypothetical protein
MILDTNIIKRYLTSFILGNLNASKYKNVRTYCMFIGYGRSGHSLIGALLDAHPNISIGMEEDVLNLIKCHFSRNQIFYCITRNARIFRKKHNNTWTGYSYKVQGQYQGTFTRLEIIGDKKGAASSMRLGDNFGLYNKLEQTVRCPVRIIHVIRNPFDNISTMINRNLGYNKLPDRHQFLYYISKYFLRAGVNKELKMKNNLNIVDIYHEDFIAGPRENLKKILDFLGISGDEKYYRSCEKIIYESPNKSKFSIKWPAYFIDLVHTEIQNYQFLQRYSYHD